MNKIKYVIGILLLFMVIGFATVTVTLSINGNAKILSDLDQFKVYFSDVKLNGSQDLSLVKSENELQFYFSFTGIGTTQVISYDVTNASKIFDASLNISCTSGDEYFSVVNVFDTSTNLEALGTRTGTLTMKKLKSISSDSDKDYSVTCTIDATPIERDSEAGGSIISPVQPIQLYTGNVISIDGENFNVISQTDTTVTMLAQYNLGTDYRQSTISNEIMFASGTGWEYTPGPKEIYFQNLYPGTYINEYVLYLQEILGDIAISGTLITLTELKSLGCTINDDYSYSDGLTCANSSNKLWLVNGQSWWTRSANADDNGSIWYVNASGGLGSNSVKYYHQWAGVRPVITVPIEIARYYSLKKYEPGDEVSIGDEVFNVLSDNGTTVTVLARYNVASDSTIGYTHQNSDQQYTMFSGNFGWEYTPGPNEVDLSVYTGDSYYTIQNYLSFFTEYLGIDDVSGDLITVSQLGDLGCTVPSDYSYGSGGWTCIDSEHSDWLINEHYWWTKSSATTSPGAFIWGVGSGGALNTYDFESTELGVRPVITISKESLN